MLTLPSTFSRAMRRPKTGVGSFGAVSRLVQAGPRQESSWNTNLEVIPGPQAKYKPNKSVSGTFDHLTRKTKKLELETIKSNIHSLFRRRKILLSKNGKTLNEKKEINMLTRRLKALKLKRKIVNKSARPGTLQEENDNGNHSIGALSSAIGSFPFASASSQILEEPAMSRSQISAFDMFIAKGPHLPQVVMSTGDLLEQRKEPSYLQSESSMMDLHRNSAIPSMFHDSYARSSVFGGKSNLLRRSVGKRGKKKKKVRIIEDNNGSYLDHRNHNNNSYYENDHNSLSPLFKRPKATNILSKFAVQNIPGGDNWNSSSPELVIEEFYKRVIACMIVNKCRNVDIFRICDFNDDGSICETDFLTAMKFLNLKISGKSTKRYFKKVRKRWNKKHHSFQSRFNGAQQNILSKDMFLNEISSRNHTKQSRLESRMKTYTRRHARMMEKIRNVRDEAVNKYGPKTKAFTDFYDVTRTIPDPDGAKFWKKSFGKTCGKVSLNEFMKQFRKYFNDVRKLEGLASLRSPTSGAENGGNNQSGFIFDNIKSYKSGKQSSPKTSPNTKLKQEKKWILKRVKNLIADRTNIVTVHSFVNFLNVFGPTLHSTLENVIIGKLQSQQQIRSFRYKLRSEREKIKNRSITFSSRTVVHDLSLSTTMGRR